MVTFESNPVSNKIKITIIGILSVAFYLIELIFKSPNLLDFSQIVIILGISFVIVTFVSFHWLNSKMTYEIEDDLKDTGKIPLISVLIASLYFSSFLIICYAILFNLNEIFITSNEAELLTQVLFFLLTMNNLIILFHFNSAFKPQNRPNSYIFKSYNRFNARISNNFDTIFSIKVISFISVFVIPGLILYFVLENIVLSYFIFSLILGTLSGSYWLGYGLYKHFIWIWGVPNINSSNNNNNNTIIKTNSIINLSRNLNKNEGQSVLFGFFFTSFSVSVFLFELIQVLSQGLGFPIELKNFILVLYLIILYINILSITGNRTISQPWYSSSFTMFSYSIPLYLLISFQYIFSFNNHFFISKYITITPLSSILLVIFNFIGLIICFRASNRYLKELMWKDSYEANQLLTSIKQSIDEPTSIQLNLLQKLSNTMEDDETIIKIIASYQLILESHTKNQESDSIDGMVEFITNQIQITENTETLDLLFNLTHNLLDKYPHYAEKLFEPYYNILDIKNSFIKIGSFNVIGQIFQITRKQIFIEKTFNVLEKLYNSPEDKLKRLTLDALMFFVKNFPEYNSKIKSFLQPKLEIETFGIATIIFDILAEIHQQDNDNEIFEIAKSILESLDSPSKLGVVNFLKLQMPVDKKEQKYFIELFFKNLRDVDNAVGVRTNILYAINELIKKDPTQVTLLNDLEFLIEDPDPDVKSALIQITTDQFLLGRVNYEAVLKTYKIGMKEQDYVVRLVIIQSLKLIKHQNSDLLNNFKEIIDSASNDESQLVQEEIRKLKL